MNEGGFQQKKGESAFTPGTGGFGEVKRGDMLAIEVAFRNWELTQPRGMRSAEEHAGAKRTFGSPTRKRWQAWRARA